MPGRVSTGPAKVQKPKAQRKRKNRALNAFAIAEKEVPDTTRLRRSRLGEVEGPKRQRTNAGSDSEDSDEDIERRSKRPRPGDLDEDGEAIEGGSDSEGNQWVTGRVPSDEDSDIESDEAFGDSDEERFASFTFRGSKSTSMSKKRHHAPLNESDQEASIDLGEEDDEPSQDGSDAESEGFAADALDPAAVLDQRDSESEAEESVDVKLRRKAHKTSVSNEEDVEDDRSVLSVSEDELEEQGAANFASLQAFVAGLGNGNSKKTAAYQPDSHEALVPSEYGVTARQKLQIEDLMPSVTDPKARKALRALAADDGTSTKIGNGNSLRLAVPLPKRQQDRIDQAAAYDQSKKTLNRWIETVKQNRRAEHLSFPIIDPTADEALRNKQLAPTVDSKPATSLEATIQNILEESGMAGKEGKSQDEIIQEMEELEERNMPIEDVRARRAELRRARDLLFREEIKARRIKKIKSKAFRRVHRKARQRDLLKEQQDGDEGAEPDEEDLERMHRIRAEERMGARHRASKWAKAIKSSGRAVWDDDARNSMHEMARREEELMKRMAGKDIDADSMDEQESAYEDEIDSEDENEDAFAIKIGTQLNKLQEDDRDGGTRLSNLPFMKKAEAASKKRNDEAIEAIRKELDGDDEDSEGSQDEIGEAPGRRTFGPQREEMTAVTPQEARNEFEEPEEAEEGPSREFLEQELREEAIAQQTAAKPAQPAPKPKKGLLSSRSTNSDRIQEPNDFHMTEEVTAPPSASEWKLVPQKHRLKPRTTNEPDVQISLRMDPTPAAAQADSQARSQPSAASKARDADDDATSDSGSDSDSDASAVVNPLAAAAAQTALTAKAFASNDDTVAAEFRAEKAALEAEEDADSDAAKGTDPDALPGWGNWVGEGLSKAEQRRQQQRAKKRKAAVVKGDGKEAAKKAPRQDRANAKVIVSEKRSARNAAYLADQLPHPFESRAQYERSMRLPIGHEWSTVGRFQEATKPRVLVKKGRVIAPIRKPLA